MKVALTQILTKQGGLRRPRIYSAPLSKDSPAAQKRSMEGARRNLCKKTILFYILDMKQLHLN